MYKRDIVSYKKWFDKHAKKHKDIVDKLIKKGFTKNQIIEYFDFENMVQNEVSFCPLYKQNKRCHEINNLNCYLCACPYFRFDENGIESVDLKVVYSFCSINSKEARQSIHSNSIHLDCSQCCVAHDIGFIQKCFSEDWQTMMKGCMN